jgi:hypothetical protein
MLIIGQKELENKQMTKSQKFAQLRNSMESLEGLLNNSLDFHMSEITIPQVSNSTYLMNLKLKNKHYFNFHDNQFLQFNDPLKAKAFIDALYILITRQPSHEQGQAIQFVVHSLMTSKQYLHE